jgi:hypothetical protein
MNRQGAKSAKTGGRKPGMRVPIIPCREPGIRRDRTVIPLAFLALLAVELLLTFFDGSRAAMLSAP